MAFKPFTFTLNHVQNGHPIRILYTLQHRKGTQLDRFYRHTFTKDMLKDLKELSSNCEALKYQFPLLNLFESFKRSRSDFHVTPALHCCLAVDFDKIPPNFKSKRQFFKAMFNRFSKHCIVINSVSGFPKILFCLTNYQRIDELEALRAVVRRLMEVAERRLDVTLVDYVDFKYAAMTKTFMNSDSLKSFADQVKTNKNLKVWGDVSTLAIAGGYEIEPKEVFKKLQEIRSSRAVAVPRVEVKTVEVGDREVVAVPILNALRLADVLVPSELLSLSNSKFLRPLVQALCAAPSAIEGGVIVPLVKLSEIGCSYQTIQNLIKILTLNGYLQRLSVGNSLSRKASRYEFVGTLRNLRDEWKIANTRAPVPPAHTIRIEDGDWHTQLFAYTCHFLTADEYIDYIKDVPGINDKADRMKQAHAAWKSHEKRNQQFLCRKLL